MSQNGIHNPFPGLRAFEPEEDYLFFGREKETDELRRRLRTTRFLAVIGSSGSGKSSLVKSGLIPSLHAGFMAQAGSNWRVAMLRPGEDPIGNLVKALQVSEVVPAMSTVQARDKTVLEVTLRDSSLGVAEAVRHAMLPMGDNLLVVVDQFEELFRFKRSRTKHNDDESVAFVKLLLDAAHQDYASVYVVITMRSEFIGDCMPFPGLPEAINEGLYLIPRMSRDEMRAAITKPVAVSGATIAPRLVVRLLNEVGDEMDRLPVLQHALMRTWDNWNAERRARNAEFTEKPIGLKSVKAEGEDLHSLFRTPPSALRLPIDLRHYEAIGTMRSGLSRHGEEAYNDLPSERAKGIAERLFKTITDTTEEGRGVRNPAPLGRIAAVCAATEPEVAEVIETFRQPGRAFLQPPKAVPLNSDSIIDISHESLMRLWDRLVAWTKDEARSTEIYDRLNRSATRHAAGEESLWRNPQLQIGLRWRNENHPTAAWAGDEQGFARSMKFLDRSRLAHLLRRAALITAVLCVIGGLAGWVYQQYKINRALKAQLASLTQKKAEAKIETAAVSQEVIELRHQNEQLKESITDLQFQQAALNQRMQTRRDENKQAEDQLKTLNTENQQLAENINKLRDEAEELSDTTSNLEYLRDSLARQKQTLTEQIQRLTKEAEVADARRAKLYEKALWLVEIREVLPVTPPRRAGAIGPEADVMAALFQLPRDIRDNDALRRQIEELQRQLDELRAERARQTDEVQWLKQENELLAQQQQALRREIQRLQKIETELIARSQALQKNIAAAQTQQGKLQQIAQDKETENAVVRKEVAALRETTATAQDKNNASVDQIQGIQRNIDRSRYQGDEYAAMIAEHLGKLLAPDAQASAETAALLAVAAFRVAPYDPDDPAHPEIYNALWQALRRLDNNVAQALIAPQAKEKRKIGLTTSEELIKAICARVNRSFTPEEWQRYFPPTAQFDKLGQPCK